jgi:glycosyltransferase involved in cell wall biosynthesis
MDRYPKISIITPSYNQGKYIEATIQSVSGQNYPNLEYIIMDGGSEDNSIEIIKKYEPYLYHWESHKDNGQADAINQGFSISTGDIMAWLNSDDMYLPGTLDYIAQIFLQEELERDLRIVFGNCLRLNEELFETCGSNVGQAHKTLDITLCDYIIQPSAFWTRKTFEAVGKLEERLTYGFDWEWFIRAKRSGVKLQPIDKFLSIYRIHADHKTKTGGEKRLQELSNIYRNFHSERMALTYLKYKGREDNIAGLNRIMRKLRIDQFVNPTKLLYHIYFAGIRWEEFENIRRM